MKSLIYLIRHGEVDRPPARAFLGQTDLPLNDNGIRQALALREQLKEISFKQVITSPLQRAVQTAALISGLPTESLKKIEAFKEINLGEWEGLTVDEVRQRFPGDYEQRGRDLEFFDPRGRAVRVSPISSSVVIHRFSPWQKRMQVPCSWLPMPGSSACCFHVCNTGHYSYCLISHRIIAE